MILAEYGHEFTVTKEFFNKYIHPHEKLSEIIVPIWEDPPAVTLANILAHYFNSEKDIKDFIEAFNLLLKKHDINEESLNGLLYFIFYVNHHGLEFNQKDYSEKTTLERAKTLIDIMLMPFEEIHLEGSHFEVDLLKVTNPDTQEEGYANDMLIPIDRLKHLTQKELRDLNPHNQLNLSNSEKQIFEISKAVQFTISSTTIRKTRSIKIDEGFNQDLLYSIVTLLHDNIKEQNPNLFNNIINWNFDYNHLHRLRKTLTNVKKTSNNLVFHLTKMMLPFLEDECGLLKGKSEYISIDQSAFLFDFFAILDVWTRKPSLADIEKAKTALNPNTNPYSIKVRAFSKKYSNYRKHIQEIYNGKMAINQPVKSGKAS